MSQKGERSDQRGAPGLESGLEALRQSSEFRGPVEHPDGHDHSNDHLALVYESHDEQFAAAIPFVRQGLERGERCLYVADENTKEEVLKAMRAADIDVDAARESGALTIHTKQDTYLRGGEFDRDAMLEFWEHSLEQATDEDGYTGIRAAAEMTWALDGDTSPDLLAEYEAVLNDLYEDEDYAVLCQYNRERFPAAVIHDVIKTHPHLIHDGAVYTNGYYEPPEEFFGPVQPANEVDRKLGTLKERTETKMELKQRREHLEQIFESSHDAILLVDPEADEVIEANPAASEMLGYSRDELLSRGPSDLHPDELDRFYAFVDRVFEDGSGWTDELTCRTRDWGRIAAEISASQIEYDDRPVMLAAIRDISDRKRREQLLEAQKELLERIASGAPLEECLSALCAAVSRLNAGVRASILLADDEREAFEHPIAPDLSPSWGEGLEDAPINDLMIGTCGTAVFRGESITCEDVANDDRWSKDWRDVCIDNGVLAGHSEPILDADGTPEGSFMLCFDEPREPNEWEQRLAEFGTHVAGIALERDRSRQALRESEERLRLALESGEMGVWELDLGTEEAPVRSLQHDRIFGYEEPLDDWSVEHFLDHVHPDDREWVEHSFEDTFETGEWEFECRIIRADDEQRWISAQGEFYYDSENEPIRAVGIVQDISERKERERSQRRLYEIAADPDWTFDEKLETVLELGCDRFDLEVGGIARIDPATDSFEVETIRGNHDHLVPGEQYPLSETYCRLVTDDGKTAAVTDPVSEGFEGKLCYERFGVQAYLGIHLELDSDVDRTLFFVSNEPRAEEFSEAERTFHHLMGQWVEYELERRNRERELCERTEHLSALIETTPECIKTVAADGTLLQMNPAGLDMVEADSASDVTGECVYDLIAPEHRERFCEFNERICRGERGTLEFDIIGLEGTRRHMESHAAPMPRPDGTTVQVALTRDITEQVDRERQLEETVQKLEESNERLEQFAYAASHDLQEPLRMVSTYLQLIERRYAAELDEDGQEFIEFAVDGADRMRSMINALLEYSRVETRGDPFEPVELDTVFADVRDDLRMRIEESDADITVDSLPRVDGDEEQLRQVFQNLLDNAIEYSGDKPPQVDVSAERDGSEWAVSVSDEGIGIDSNDADRVFNVFQRLHTHEEHAGAGIGLALCERIVERHGGDIWVESEPGEGATFFFTLPHMSTPDAPM